MPVLKTGNECCGCTACAAVCPKDAIRMVPDSMGFKYPEVNYDKCVECGLCEKTCSFTDDYKTPENFSQPIPYGARLKSIEQLMKSRSGGAFVAFSDWILDKGGVIYGCGYNGHFNVAHKRATDATERDQFRGSKYVQSDLNGIFRNVKEDLKQGRWVLFSGTPCQTSGLTSYIPDKLKDRLVTVDIVCHGVPSPYIWSNYLSYIEKKEKKEVTAVDFRDKKRFGWKSQQETLTLRDPLNGAEEDKSFTIYTYLFHQDIMLRPSCGDCKFCNLRRPSDLTLADFWGWEKTDKTINKDDRGISLVFANTPKGERIFEETKYLFNIIRPKLSDCMQSHLKLPTPLNPKSVSFKNDFEKKGFRYVLNKYGNVSWNYHLHSFIERCMRKLKKIVKL